MYDLRYPEYVEELLEGTEGKEFKESLEMGLRAMLSNADEDAIKLLFELYGGKEGEWDETCDPVDFFIQWVWEYRAYLPDMESPAYFLDGVATRIMDEFDAYDVTNPIEDDLI